MTTIPFKSNFFDSPITKFDNKSGVIAISGSVIPLDSNYFWRSMHKQLLYFTRNSLSRISIRFQIEYIHSASVEGLLGFLELLKRLIKHQDSIEIVWLYENGDEDMFELGNLINEIVRLPVKCILVE